MSAVTWRTAVVAMAMAAGAPGAAVAAGRAVVVPSEDGTPLAAMLYEAADRPAPGVVLVHMLGRSKSDFARLAGELQRAGATALAIDLRGHGESGGARVPLAHMVQDVKAAVGWLAARPGVRPDAVAVIGASLGANLALAGCADHPAVRGFALISPSLDYQGVRVDPALVTKAGGRALLLVASTEDPYALRTIRELAEADAARVEQRLAAAAAHGTNLLAADGDLVGELVDWARRTLVF